MTAEAPLIGIVGGYGAVGAAVARELLDGHDVRLRIGGRRIAEARRLVQEELDGGAEAVAVDVTDRADLDGFCEGCRIVVNCTGPSYRIADMVAWAALPAGADYVDVGGYDAVHGLLGGTGLVDAGQRAILSAGVLPGLSGLLPRLLAGYLPAQPQRLCCYIGGLDRLSAAAAADVLDSLHGGFGESLGMWRAGGRVSGALTPLTGAEMPLFPGPVSAVPYLSAEAERLARDLGLTELRWYNVYPGAYTLGSLSRAQARGMHGQDQAAVAALVRAAELDLAGSYPYLIALAQLDGESDGRSITRSLMMRATEPSELSGAVAAVAARAALAGDIPPGVHHAAEVLPPSAVEAALRRSRQMQILTVLEDPLDAAPGYEEGAL